MTVKCPATGMGCTSHCPDPHFCENQRNPVQGLMPEQRRVQIPDPWPVNPRRDTVYTIMWYYSDKSDSGVVEVAFRRREDAEELRQLLIDHGGTKEFMICQSVLKG